MRTELCSTIPSGEWRPGVRLRLGFIPPCSLDATAAFPVSNTP